MSDAMTNTEADEVLASIRRLVAETHGHRPVPVSAPVTAAVPSMDVRETAAVKPHSEPAAEALVLTPDFRVRQSAAPEPVAQAPLVLEPLPDAATAEEGAVEPLILSPDLAVHLPDEVATQQTGIEGAENPTLETLIAEEVQAEARAMTAAAETAEADWAEALDDTPDAEAARHVARLTLEQRIAELEAAVGAQGLDWEPDGSEDLDAEIPREMPRGFIEPGARVLHFRAREAAPLADAQGMDHFRDEQVSDEPVAEDQAQDMSADAWSGDKDDAAMSQSEETKPLSDEIGDAIADAEVIEETPAPQAGDTPEPLEMPAPEAQTPEVEDLGAAPEVAHDPDPSLEEELALAGYADEDIMDEEALRDLVAQVIREELQGELGQRITANVRRLVRREVQRALTLREFE
ncbi:hypothetical protein [Celeribacter sp. SCSIO 80788]|uniref:hypothetical protein n=1 Tax=Celeribacter sp. SCSIO 80788 TaxID=3117013 RepID=UPI003DA2022A